MNYGIQENVCTCGITRARVMSVPAKNTGNASKKACVFSQDSNITYKKYIIHVMLETPLAEAENVACWKSFEIYDV